MHLIGDLCEQTFILVSFSTIKLDKFTRKVATKASEITVGTKNEIDDLIRSKI